MGAIGQVTGERFVGPVSYWVDELVRLVELGMDAFIFWPAGEGRERQVEIVRRRVAPAARMGARSVSGSP